MFWLAVFLWVGFTIIGELLRPKPKFDAPTPSGIGDFSVPTAQAGRAIPAIFGTVKLRSPNVVWYGDLVVTAIKEKVKTGIFSSKTVTKGYKYSLGQQMVLCHGPVDAITEMRFDDRAVRVENKYMLKPISIDTNDGLSWRDQYLSNLNAALVAAVGEDEASDFSHIKEIAATSHELIFNMTPVPTVMDGMTWTFKARTRRNTGTWTLPRGVYCEIYKDGLLVHQFRMEPTSSGAFWTPFTADFSASEIAALRAGSPANFKARIFSADGGVGQGQFSWIQVQITAALGSIPDGWDSEGRMQITVNEPALFGGEEREGGIVGRFDFYRGSADQNANDYLQTAIGVPLPGYKGLAYVVARRPYVGTSPYLKLISFVVRRCPNGLGMTGGMHNINGDANPACIIHDVLTNATWGCGVPASLIDADSFIEAGKTLFAEGLGVSMIFDSQDDASALIGEVLRHADGVVFVDPATGRLRLKLARPDYQVSDLIRLDESSGGLTTVKMVRPSWNETRNIVKVHYVERAQNFTDRVAQAQDLANIQSRGGEVSEDEFSFRGLSSAAAAQLAAARVLRTVCYPLAALELETNRRAWRLRPGELFRLTWGPLGIADMACRVTRIRLGDPRDGRIMVDAVEDIFGVAWTAYSNPGGTEWVDPIQPPAIFAAKALVESPYAMVVGPERVVLTLAGNGSPAAVGYQVWSDPAGSIYAHTNDVGKITPIGLLDGGPGSGDIGYTSQVLRIVKGAGMESLVNPTEGDFLAGSAVLLIDDEFMAWTVLGDNGDGTVSVNVVRGVMDTTPVPHAGGSRVWFVSDGAGATQLTPYLTDVTVRAKLLGFNSKATRELADESEVSVTTVSRAQRPYVPTNFKINGESYPVLIAGALALTWDHRNRLGAWTFDNAGLTASPEAGTTYTIRLYDQLNVLRKTYSGLSGTSQTWTTETADSGLPGSDLNSMVRIEIEAVVSLVSYQIINYMVFRNITEASPVAGSMQGRVARRRRRRRLMAGASSE